MTLGFETIRDNRGVTLVAPLRNPVVEHDGTGTWVSVWYNRTERSWVVQVTDGRDGYQVGTATYTYHRGDALAEAQRLIGGVEHVQTHVAGLCSCGRLVTSCPAWGEPINEPLPQG